MTPFSKKCLLKKFLLLKTIVWKQWRFNICLWVAVFMERKYVIVTFFRQFFLKREIFLRHFLKKSLFWKKASERKRRLNEEKKEFYIQETNLDWITIKLLILSHQKHTSIGSVTVCGCAILSTVSPKSLANQQQSAALPGYYII